MKILIVKLSALGDVVQTLPSLTLLKKALPFAQIDWVVDERNAEILQNHPYIYKLIVFSRKILKSPFRIKSFLQELRREKYDCVIDYQGLLKSGLIIGFSRAKYKIGFSNHREGSPFFYNIKLPPYDKDLHAVKRYLDLTKEVLRVLGVYQNLEKEEKIPEVIWSEDILNKKLNFIKRPYIVFVPSARWKTKLWLYSSWEELIKLCKKWGKELDIFITGAPGETKLKTWAESMEKKYLYVYSLAGKLKLKEIVSFIAGAKLVVTVDTGPMHIASALKIPTVALFGPTSPQRTGPWNGKYMVLKADLPCMPCFKKECKDWKCMKEIKASQVHKAMEKLLTE